MNLADAANTLVPAYLSIVAKGYVIRRDGRLMVAERDENRFVADDPLSLLGLIAIFEMRGTSWQALDQEIEAYLADFG